MQKEKKTIRKKKQYKKKMNTSTTPSFCHTEKKNPLFLCPELQ